MEGPSVPLRLEKVSDFQIYLCLFLAVIAAGLATNPFFQSAVNDDWVYSVTANRYAQTGHISYVGDAAVPMLIQAVYGAWLTRVFGGSFVTYRLGTLFLSAFMPVLVYLLALQFGLRRQMAFFGAMTFGWCPLFVPHAVSFMTDCYGCLFFLAAICAGIRSLDETRLPRATVWFALAMLLSFAGGISRQPSWVTGPAIAGAWCLARRKQPRAVFWGVALLAIFCGSCVLLLHWLARQPGFRFDVVNLASFTFSRSELSFAVRDYIGLILTTVAFAIPALLAGVPLLRRPRELLAACLAFAVIFVLSDGERLLIFPYLSDVVTEHGLFCPGFVLGSMPDVLPYLLRRLIMAVAGGLLGMLYFSGLRTARTAEEPSRQDSHAAHRMTAGAILIPLGSMAAYLLVLVMRAKKDDLYDRYALPLIPFMLLGVLVLCQRQGLRRPGLAAWLALTLFGVYGVAITHDHFEQMRARLLAVHTLQEAKVPRESIMGGLEDDMWTQVALAGNLTWLPASKPAIWYLKQIDRIKPLFFLATSDVPHMSVCKIPPVDYSTWLSPRNRQILILCPD